MAKSSWQAVIFGTVPVVGYLMAPQLGGMVWGFSLPDANVARDYTLIVTVTPEYWTDSWLQATLFSAAFVVLYLALVRPLLRSIDVQIAA